MKNDPIALDRLSDLVEAKAPAYAELSDRIWAMPELRFAEHRSAEAQIAQLEAEGFRVTRNVAGIPTAFMAEAGEGGPLIGFLGEFDALAGLSQEAGLAEKRALEAGGNGHGCGHNLLGAGAMLAAVSARDALREAGMAGRVRYYGCPGEEGGSGKTFMAREGAFDGLDAAVTWHPGAFNGVMSIRNLANFQVYFRFKGKAAHAAGSPHLGRSALDAVELMNVGVNYLREHMPQEARVHYAITNSGGVSPNVVQAEAEVLYLVRAPRVAEAAALFERVKDCAKGAAIMSGTSWSFEIDKACSEVLPNRTLETVLHGNFQTLGAAEYDEADQRFAGEIRRSLSAEDIASEVASFAADPALGDVALHEAVLPFDGTPLFQAGSTDVGDVSQIVPTVQAWGACWAVGTPFHTWQAVAQGQSAHAHKGMAQAAKVMAATALDGFRDPELLARAKAELAKRRGAAAYECPIPAEVVAPPLRARR
ncbi:M20 family metallopeptidase [Muricoccus vinaceus]|uniref:M20 family metallopeptidase n=1 Tax=Muricoccus vinaceus TaxID=424704 RepID=A0ABV6IZH7_9PROT